MKKTFLFWGIVVTLLIGCGSVDDAMKLYVRDNADQVEILFHQKSTEKGDQPILVASLTDPTDIKKVVNFVTNKKAPFYKCGYTGSMFFLGEADTYVVQRIDFNIQPGCEHAVFSYDNKLYARELSPDGLIYLDSLFQNTQK